MNRHDLTANRVEAGDNPVGFFRALDYVQCNRANREEEMRSSPSLGDDLTYQREALRPSIQE
jgi:hypothetical protein